MPLKGDLSLSLPMVLKTRAAAVFLCRLAVLASSQIWYLHARGWICGSVDEGPVV